MTAPEARVELQKEILARDLRAIVIAAGSGNLHDLERWLRIADFILARERALQEEIEVMRAERMKECEALRASFQDELRREHAAAEKARADALEEAAQAIEDSDCVLAQDIRDLVRAPAQEPGEPSGYAEGAGP